MTGSIRLVFLLAAAALGAGCHSDSFALANYGAIGPQHPGPEALIADTGSAPTWTDDGSGILYTTDGPPVDSSGCPTIKRPQPHAGGIAAIVMLPAAGGSAIWTHCESRGPMVLKPDSAEMFPAVAMATGGRLLYVEAIGSNLTAPRPCLCAPFPVGWHAELWVVDTGAASAPRRLVTLYHDHLGQSPFGPDDIDWLTDAHWIGAADFVALGQNLNPMGVFTNLGVVRGNTGASTVRIVAGTAGAQHYSMAENSASIVFTNDGATIERVGVGGGTPTVVAQIGAVADISCKGEFCLVLAGSQFWSVNLATRVTTSLANDSHRFVSARVSPVSNSIAAAVSGGGIYLLTDVIH